MAAQDHDVRDDWDDTISDPDDCPYNLDSSENGADMDLDVDSSGDERSESYYEYASDDEIDPPFDQEKREYGKYEGHMDESTDFWPDDDNNIVFSKTLDSGLLSKLKLVLNTPSA